MKKHGFFNLVLVLSFLLSNLGSTTTNQNIYPKQWISWDFKAIVERISSWMEEQLVDTQAVDDLLIIKGLPTATPTPGLGIPPTPEPTRTPEPTLEPTREPTLTPTNPITPTLTPTPDPGFVLAAIDVTLEPDPAAPGDVVTATWTIRNYHGQYEGVEIWMYLPEAFLPLEVWRGEL